MIDLYFINTRFIYKDKNNNKNKNDYFKPDRYSSVKKNKMESSSFFKDKDFL